MYLNSLMTKSYVGLEKRININLEKQMQNPNQSWFQL